MKLFDANASFGVDMINHECVNHENFIVLEQVEIARNAKELIAQMDYAGIEKASVWHRAQYEQDATAGNMKLINGIKGYEDRLIPSWVILPDITDTQYAPDVFFPQMKEHGVKTLRAFPEQDRFILCKVTMGEQLSLLSELKIPLYLSPMNGFEQIYKVMEEFPKLTVILSNIGWWPSARLIYPLLRAYPNFYFETGDFSQLHGFEEVVSKFGSERILYGSNFPTNSMAGSIYTLLKSNISDDDRENIAHRNMERLLGEVKL
ncbi:MAG: amidohydrolase family protein [Clostridia bacterium]|nr:amidohydrolase family protein [Clostridia bacterium]